MNASNELSRFYVAFIARNYVSNASNSPILMIKFCLIESTRRIEGLYALILCLGAWSRKGLLYGLFSSIGDSDAVGFAPSLFLNI